MKGRLLICLLLLYACLDAQTKRWNVRISVSREIVSHADVSEKGQCEATRSKGDDRTFFEATVGSDSLVEIPSAGELQLNSDMLKKPLTGSGIFSNSGNTYQETNCTCDGCGECRQTSTSSTSSGSGQLDLSKITFSFSYNIEKKQGTLNFSCGYIKNGTASKTTRDCSESKTVSYDQLYGAEQNLAELGYGQFVVQNFDLYKEAGFDENTIAQIRQANKMAGLGGLASITPFNGGYEVSYSYTSTNTEPAKSTLTGGESEVSGGSEISITTTVQATFTPYGKYRAFLEPVEGWASYKKWLPEGNIKDEKREPGNSTGFIIRMVDNDYPDKKLHAAIKEIVYELKDVSHLPGVCMNYPSRNADSKADLSLYDATAVGEAAQNTELARLSVRDIGMGAVIQSFDFGGSARLTATITLATGEVLTAESSEDHKPYVTIPYRKDNSLVSSYWKEQNSASNLSDKDDNDPSEDGIGENYPGDGYTVFEEYRGFRENKKHIRTDPGKKDIMICNRIDSLRSRDGIALYQGVTHFMVHQDFKAEEFGRKLDVSPDAALFTEYGTENFSYDKVLNYNNLSQLHSVDQHGILMLPSPKKLGAAFAVTRQGAASGIGPPKNYAFLVIPADFDTSTKGYAVARGDVRKDTAIYNSSGKGLIITDFYASRVAHEMLHYSNVPHHGENDYWYGHYYSNFNSVLFQEMDMQGKYGVDRDHDGLADSKEITLIDVDGKEVKPGDPRWMKGGVWERGLTVFFVARQNGQHSGNDNCIMRYDVAQAYEKGNTHYLLFQPSDLPRDLTPFNQITGIQLCDSKNGTGINAGENGRYGDAANGNCKSRVCINDKYN